MFENDTFQTPHYNCYGYYGYPMGMPYLNGIPQKIDGENHESNIERHEQADKILAEIATVYGNQNALNSVIASLETEYGLNLKKCRKELGKIDSFREQVSEYINQIAYPRYYMEILDGAFEQIHARCIEEGKRLRENEYGALASLKSNFRETLCTNLKYTDWVELLNYFKSMEKQIVEERDAAHFSVKESYDSHLRFYRSGITLIRDKLNHINKNKAKTVSIPPHRFNNSMKFIYDTATFTEAEQEQLKDQYSYNKKRGEAGEKKVNFTLKFLDPSLHFTIIKPLSTDICEMPCIKIVNSDYVDVKQEYDHIIVGKAGVIVIEDKNLSGKIIIDKNGNWIRIHKGKENGMANPLQQVRQHEKVLKSILPKEVPVQSVICIANDNAIIEGLENSPITIVKSDMLLEVIETNTKFCDGALSQEQIDECVHAIYEYMIKE